MSCKLVEWSPASVVVVLCGCTPIPEMVSVIAGVLAALDAGCAECSWKEFDSRAQRSPPGLFSPHIWSMAAYCVPEQVLETLLKSTPCSFMFCTFHKERSRPRKHCWHCYWGSHTQTQTRATEAARLRMSVSYCSQEEVAVGLLIPRFRITLAKTPVEAEPGESCTCTNAYCSTQAHEQLESA